jgi:hypothetical protein
MRRFYLVRTVDVSGVSGTGIVAEGVQFHDGSVAVRWRSEHPSTVTWARIEDAMVVHGHDGLTKFEWVDDPAGVVGELDRMLRDRGAYEPKREEK